MKENTTFAGVNNGFPGLVMRRLWMFILMIFLLFAGDYAKAGEHDEVPGFTQTFSFTPYPDRHTSLVNDVLHTIAEGSGKLRVYTSYSFQGRFKTKLVPLADGRHGVIVTSDTMYVTGDVTYRDFSLAGILIPDRADFLMEVHDAEGEEVFCQYFEDVDMTARPDELVEVSFSYNGPTEELSVKLSDYQFRYDERMRERLSRWDAALDAYYEAGDKLERAEELTDGLSADDPATLLLEEFRLCEAEALLGDIRHAPFQQWPDLSDHDPERILPAYNRLRRRLSLLREDFNLAVSRIDDLYYQQGEMISRSESPETARDAYESALNYNPLHIPSHLALAELDKNSGDKEAALERLGMIFEKGHPSGQWKREAKLLTDTVLEMFFSTSSELILENRLTSSLDNLAHVQVFCSRVEDNYPCPEALRNMLIQTHEGIYRSFLVVSGRATRDGNIDLAATYVQNAIEYQRMYPAYVPSSEEAYELLYRVMTRYRVLSDFFFLIGEPGAGDESLAKVRIIARNHPELFDFVSGAINLDVLETSALNYAAAGQLNRSIILLKELENRGVSAREAAQLQRRAGKSAAYYFKNDKGSEENPQTLVNELIGADPWFSVLKQSFLDSW